jgi:hypothetical protein
MVFFCILPMENTPVRGVLKFCLVTSFHARNRRKCHFRGSRFQIFSLGHVAEPLQEGRTEGAKGPPWAGRFFSASYATSRRQRH